MVVHQGFNDIANRSLKFLLAVWAYEPYLLVVACRYFTGRAIVLVTPHGSGHRALGSQIIDTRNNLATCANRATCTAILYGMNYIADRSFKLLLTIGAYEPRFLVAACRYFAGGVCVLCTPHSENLRTLGSQIIDARDDLDTCTNRATGITTHQGPCGMENTGFKLLLTIGAYEPRFLVAAYRYFARGVCVLGTPHSGNLRTLGSQIVDARNDILGIDSIGIHGRLSFSSYFRGLK
jgi:hypothetical protein